MRHQQHGRPVADGAPRVLPSNCNSHSESKSKLKSKSELTSLQHHDSLREESYWDGIVVALMAPLIRNYGSAASEGGKQLRSVAALAGFKLKSLRNKSKISRTR